MATNVGSNHGGGEANGESKVESDIFNSGASLDLSSLSNVSYTGHTITEGLTGNELQGALSIMANGMAQTAGTAMQSLGHTILNSSVAKVLALCAVAFVGWKIFGKRR